MTTAPGADERRIRQLLLQRGVGPDAPARTRPRPADDSWWDRIYDSNGADTHTPTVRTVPGRARITSGRLPDWRKGETTDLVAPAEDPGPEDEPAPDQHVEDGPDDDPDWAEATDPDDPVERAPGRPANPARAASQRATTTYLTLTPRIRWFASTGSAAAFGYGLNLVPLMQGWICSCGDTQDPTGALLLGGAMVAAGAAIAWHTRTWWPPLAWVCRIPVASALLALALYAPGATS